MELPFVPMLLSKRPQPFADPDWLYQVKWDGVRNLTLVDHGRIHHWSRNLRDRTRLFPEFDDLARAIAATRLVLDGEIIVLRGGKPSFHAILERDHGSPSPTRMRRAPATLMLFDLLELDGQQLYRQPLRERLALLERLIPADERWQVVQSFPGESGPDLFAATLQAELEGVVAKRATSIYQPGVRTSDWVKIRRKHERLAVVIGYTNPSGRPGGLLLGAYDGDRLTYIGRAGSGITSEQWSLLRQHLVPGPCPLDRVPSLRDRFSGTPGPVVWAEPRLTLWVQYSEWTEDGKLRDPVVLGFSDQPPEAAQLDRSSEEER